MNIPCVILKPVGLVVISLLWYTQGKKKRQMKLLLNSGLLNMKKKVFKN